MEVRAEAACRSLDEDPASNHRDRILRRVWLLYPDRIGKVLTGPPVRIMEIARQAAASGHTVVLATYSCEQPLPPGVEWRRLDARLVDEIPQSGDAVLVSGEIPARIVWSVARSGIPFHVDSFNMAAIEVLEMKDAIPEKAWRREISNRLLKYRTLWLGCERAYISTPSQLAFLGGALANFRDAISIDLARRLPDKCELAPMGISPDSMGEIPNPYPDDLKGRPILLWGGGIWSWFDIDSLLKAMLVLKGRRPDVALWFLAGRDPSGMAVYEAPFEKAQAQARELGLLGTNVFFNERKVTPELLPGYVRHCAAGVMANPLRMEAWCSWRTRLLDLLGAGKPLFAMGHDPLSERMARLGAARLRSSGDIEGLAADIAEVLGNPAALGTMEDASRNLGSTMAWETTLRPILDSFGTPDAYREVGRRPNAWDAIRFMTGL